MSDAPGDQRPLGAAAERAERVVYAAATHHAHGDIDTAARMTEALALEPGNVHAVNTAVTRTLRTQLARLWANGWLPVDVHQMARRNRSEVAAQLAVDAIADEIAQYAAAKIHPRWVEQLTHLGAERWWDPSSGYASEWAHRHALDRVAALRAVVELISLFMTMGALPLIVPRPGCAVATAVQQQDGAVDGKVLGKIRALLAKAESTQYPEEAEALSAKAQELMARHSIEHATAVSENRRMPVAAARRIWLDPPYLTPKSLLVAEVASANHCRSVTYEKLGFVTVLGDDLDLEHVDLLTTSLMVQATNAMISAGRQVGRGGQSRTRSFRHAFLIAYATRIGERLREATGTAVASAGNELVPVLAQRDQAVAELFDSLFGQRVVARSLSVGNAAGYQAGRVAADQAVLSGVRRSVSRR